MDESRAVLRRLERIDALDRAGAGRGQLLPELRALLEEAEAWAATEGGDTAETAIDNLRTALARTAPKLPSHDMIAV